MDKADDIIASFVPCIPTNRAFNRRFGDPREVGVDGVCVCACACACVIVLFLFVLGFFAFCFL